MTTYFYRNLDGSEYSHVLPNVAPVYLATALVPGSALEPYWHMRAQTIASSDTENAPDAASTLDTTEDKWHETDCFYSDSIKSLPGGDYYNYTTSGGLPYAIMGSDMSMGVQYSEDINRYPDPELIRDYHSLHSLLPYIQPARLQNSVFGPTLDILEEGTDYKFATAVPKKMLGLFCGRKILNRFLRTLERDDNENWEGGPVVQELRFPRHHVNHIGIRIVIAWMNRACRTAKEDMKQIRIPKNLFAALSLSRALTALGLHRDANRVDIVIANCHYKRPLYPDEIISIWNCLPKDSKYTYRMIEDLRKKRCEYESGHRNALPDAEKVFKFLEEHSELKARVDDKDYNNRKEHRPFFGTEWCARVALQTQQMVVASTDMSTHEALPSRDRGYKSSMHWLQSDNHQSGPPRNDQKKGRSQPQKHALALSDRKPKTPPSAWPQFEKTVVLRIVEAQEKEADCSGEKTDSAYDSDEKLLGS